MRSARVLELKKLPDGDNLVTRFNNEFLIAAVCLAVLVESAELR